MAETSKDLKLHQALNDPTLKSMTFLNEICIRYPEAISFAPGRPLEDEFDPKLLTVYLDRFSQYLKGELHLSEQEATRLLFQYGNTTGIIQPLIAQHLANDENIDVDANHIVVTVGAQEAMALTLRAMCASSKDAVVVPEPCYVGIVGAARLLDIPVITVPEVGGRLAIEDLEQAVEAARSEGLNPVLLYLVPSYANPSGTCLSLDERRQLLEFSTVQDIFVIEDNPYGLFAREPNKPVPTMKSMDSQDRVIYIGSFAKTGFPGARIGYAIANQIVDMAGTRLHHALAAVKSMLTVNTPPIAQAIVGGMLLECGCSLKTRTQVVAQRYSDNLNHLLVCLENHFPNHGENPVSWNSPEGGFFTLVHVPFAADHNALTHCAEEFGVLWTPMKNFYVGSGGEQTLRLSTSLLTEKEISIGIDRLARFIRKRA